MAGVSLVADAAEELERNTVNVDARTLSPSSNNVCTVDGILSYHCSLTRNGWYWFLLS
jgi:hypothetical protein